MGVMFDYNQSTSSIVPVVLVAWASRVPRTRGVVITRTVPTSLENTLKLS
jgi:hypothetical protein